MITLVPADTPVTTPVEELTVATVVVPLLKVPPVILGVKVVVEPTQTLVVPLKLGRGLTVMVTVKVSVHDAEVAITVYRTLIAELVVLVNVPVTLVAAVPAAVPVIPVTLGAAHVYVVPVGTNPFVTLTGVLVKLLPLHIVSLKSVMLGFGFTVMVSVTGQPEL